MKTVSGKKADEYRRVAAQEAQRDTSDPFAAARTWTHLVNGVSAPKDYVRP